MAEKSFVELTAKYRETVTGINILIEKMKQLEKQRADLIATIKNNGSSENAIETYTTLVKQINDLVSEIRTLEEQRMTLMFKVKALTSADNCSNELCSAIEQLNICDQ